MVQSVELFTSHPRTEDEGLLSDDASPTLLAASDASFVQPTTTAQVSSSTLTESKSISPTLPAYSGSDVASIESSLALLTVEEDERERMFGVLETIFRNALDHEKSIDLSYFGSENLWILLRRADVSSRQGYRDLDVLKTIRDVLNQMLCSGSRLLVSAAKTLADASRDCKVSFSMYTFIWTWYTMMLNFYSLMAPPVRSGWHLRLVLRYPRQKRCRR